MQNFIYFVLAQAEGAPEAPAGAEGFFSFPVMMILLLVGMYFLMIAPQRKRQKEHQKMITELDSGTKVVTIGGIYGTITNKTDSTFTLKVDDGVKIEILKSAVANVVKDGETPAKS